MTIDRRRFLGGSAAVLGAAGLVAGGVRADAATPVPSATPSTPVAASFHGAHQAGIAELPAGPRRVRRLRPDHGESRRADRPAAHADRTGAVPDDGRDAAQPGHLGAAVGFRDPRARPSRAGNLTRHRRPWARPPSTTGSAWPTASRPGCGRWTSSPTTTSTAPSRDGDLLLQIRRRRDRHRPARRPRPGPAHSRWHAGALADGRLHRAPRARPARRATCWASRTAPPTRTPAETRRPGLGQGRAGRAGLGHRRQLPRRAARSGC